MEIKVSKRELLKNLEFNVRALTAKNQMTIDTLSSILIKFEDKKMILISSGEVYFIKTILPLGVEVESKSMYVFGSQFLNSVKAISSDDINIKILDKNIKLYHGEQVYNLIYKPMDSQTDIELNNIDFKEGDTEVNIERFKSILDKTLFCVGKDQQVPTLQTIYFGEDIVLSGDGPRFTRINTDNDIRNRAMPVKILEEIRSILDTSEGSKLYFKTGYEEVYFNIDDKYYLLQETPTVDYPREKVSQKMIASDKLVYCDAKQFHSAINNLAMITTDVDRTLKIEINGNDMLLESGSASCSGKDKLSIEKENVDGTVISYFNCLYILAVANLFKDGGKICLHIYGNDTKISFSEDKEAKFIHSVMNKSKDEV